MLQPVKAEFLPKAVDLFLKSPRSAIGEIYARSFHKLEGYSLGPTMRVADKSHRQEALNAGVRPCSGSVNRASSE